MSSPEIDPQTGVKMLYLTTGHSVDMEVGGAPDQGQRYNCDHKFTHYMQIGYYKTGKKQELIEMKTDGPCHSCNDKPAPIPIGMWYEPHLDLESGKSSLHAEVFHPKDARIDLHDLECEQLVDIDGDINEEWIGYCVVAYTNNQTQRVIEQWVDRHPFDQNEKPVNNWVLTLRAVEKGDGKMFPLNPKIRGETFHVTFPRDLEAVINYEHGNGLEAEIRMHNTQRNHQESHGTDMKSCRVYEIIPPSPP